MDLVILMVFLIKAPNLSLDLERLWFETVSRVGDGLAEDLRWLDIFARFEARSKFCLPWSIDSDVPQSDPARTLQPGQSYLFLELGPLQR